MMRAAWPLVLAGAIAAPIVTWFPMLQYRFPWLGLPEYQPAQGVDLWSNQVLWTVALLIIAAIVGVEDRYLGLAVALAGLTVFWRGARLDPTHSVIFALGALMLAIARRVPSSGERVALWGLVGLGAFQIAYLIQQHLGYDLFWGPVFGGKLNATLQPFGTLGGVDSSASYVAILTPLFPLWLIPLGALVVWQSHSLGAVGALVIGLVMRFSRRQVLYSRGVFVIRRELVLVLVGGLVLLGSASYLHKETQEARVGIWRFALDKWVHENPVNVVNGYGLGGWKATVPQQQINAKYLPTNEVWGEAHNEPLQWLVETGFLGFAFLLGWLWQHFRMVRHPVWGASIAAAASDCLTWHPLHVVASAFVIILLVGLATPIREEASSHA